MILFIKEKAELTKKNYYKNRIYKKNQNVSIKKAIGKKSWPEKVNQKAVQK